MSDGYEDGTIRKTRRGFTYDIEKLDKLGIVERNGIRLIYDRMNDCLRIERMDPSLEQVIENLGEIQGDTE